MHSDGSDVSCCAPLFYVFKDSLLETWLVILTDLKSNGERMYWDGTLCKLKQLVSEELNLLENWKSPGGEVKLFISGSLSLKWQGKTKKLCNPIRFQLLPKKHLHTCIFVRSHATVYYYSVLRCRLTIYTTNTIESGFSCPFVIIAQWPVPEI